LSAEQDDSVKIKTIAKNKAANFPVIRLPRFFV